MKILRGSFFLVFAFFILGCSSSAGSRTWNEFKVPEEAIGCGFTEAVRGVLTELLGEDGYTFVGVDPVRLEPVFRDSESSRVEFDDVERRVFIE